MIDVIAEEHFTLIQVQGFDKKNFRKHLRELG